MVEKRWPVLETGKRFAKVPVETSIHALSKTGIDEAVQMLKKQMAEMRQKDRMTYSCIRINQGSGEASAS